MKLIKAYCGLLLIEYQGHFMCVDKYTDEIKIKGTMEICEQYFYNYMRQIANRD